MPDELLDWNFGMCAQVEEREVRFGQRPGVGVRTDVEGNAEDCANRSPLPDPHEMPAPIVTMAVTH